MFFSNFLALCDTHHTFYNNSELTRCIQAVLLVLTKFLAVHERERCEGLRRGWLSVPQHVNCVSAFASRHWFSVVRGACDCSAVEPDLLSESYLRDVTDEKITLGTSLWCQRVRRQWSTLCRNSRVQYSLFSCDSCYDKKIVKNPIVQEQMI